MYSFDSLLAVAFFESNLPVRTQSFQDCSNTFISSAANMLFGYWKTGESYNAPWINGEKGRQPTPCAPHQDPPPIFDKRGLFIPHLTKWKPNLNFTSDFWKKQQFFTRGGSAAGHAKQLSTIPTSAFRQIRRLCLDYGPIFTAKFKHTKSLDAQLEDFDQILKYCFSHGHSDLIIKIVYRTLLTDPCTFDDDAEAHEICWHPRLCWEGKCEYRVEPAQLFLEFKDKFRRRFSQDRVVLAPLITWTNSESTTLAFHNTQDMLQQWEQYEDLYKQLGKREIRKAKAFPPDRKLEGFFDEVELATMVPSILTEVIPLDGIAEARESFEYVDLYGDKERLLRVRKDMDEMMHNFKVSQKL
ncbi:hypothetical protein BT63DRAFT_118033 [Microthyrium microscopicum]|uniref:Uncharacterized protein n=1 Tax=Microthyrium microscopicum TaxID=703497 RepID=A0A6A6TTM6_9PEZI|nr:hypothetical protein BT63DRAFT_118033 [Microthyrium microscopicum]